LFDLDYHAFLPELILGVTVLLTLVVDIVTRQSKKYLVAIVGVIGLFAASVPIFTLAFCGSLDFCTDTGTRSLLRFLCVRRVFPCAQGDVHLRRLHRPTPVDWIPRI